MADNVIVSVPVPGAATDLQLHSLGVGQPADGVAGDVLALVVKISGGSPAAERVVPYIQKGAIVLPAMNSGVQISGTFTFPVVFASVPVVVLCINENSGNSKVVAVGLLGVTATNFTWAAVQSSGVNLPANDQLNWIAIGS